MTITADKDTMLELLRLRTAGELAEALGVGRSYLIAMKRHGFRMPGGKASIIAAKEWLDSAPEFKVDTRSTTTTTKPADD